MVILLSFSDVITPISDKFGDNSKNKNWRIVILFFLLYSAYSAYFIKLPQFLRVGGGVQETTEININAVILV